MSVENGIWASSNGQESATVTKSGATFQLGCAIGSTTQPLILDASDQFSVTGTYTLIGGPVVVGHARQFTANYTGTVSGETMILIVSFTDEASGTPQSFSYTLYYGAATDPHVICAD